MTRLFGFTGVMPNTLPAMRLHVHFFGQMPRLRRRRGSGDDFQGNVRQIAVIEIDHRPSGHHSRRLCILLVSTLHGAGDADDGLMRGAAARSPARVGARQVAIDELLLVLHLSAAGQGHADEHRGPLDPLEGGGLKRGSNGRCVVGLQRLHALKGNEAADKDKQEHPRAGHGDHPAANEHAEHQPRFVSRCVASRPCPPGDRLAHLLDDRNRQHVPPALTAADALAAEAFIDEV